MTYPNELLTEICKLLLEWEIGLDEVKNLAADLPGEYQEHLYDQAEQAWEDMQRLALDDTGYRRDLIAAGRGHLLK